MAMPRASRPKKKSGSRVAAPAASGAAAPPPATVEPPPISGPFWTTFRFQALLIAVLAVALYANTLGNGYAFDDGVVIRENTYVQQGFGGIGKILTRDAFDSYFRQMNVSAQQLPGGRYRPLSNVTFAVEQGLFGDNVAIRHGVNVVLYAVAAVLLLWLLRSQLLRDASWSLLAALIFVVHPIHTEVVANIKGRDELLSFLFIMLTLVFALRHDEKQRPLDLALAMAAYFLALLSKEYGLTLLALLPLAFFVCHRRTALESLRRTLPFLLVAVAYVSLRIAAIGLNSATQTDVLSNPYIFASPDQALATKLAVLLRYLGLLFFPYPLSSDYSYRQIPYVDFASPLPWLSLAVHVGLLTWGTVLALRRDVRAFGVFFYLATLAIVSNLLLDIGAFMGERLVFHASFGFALVVAGAALSLTRRVGADLAGGSARRVAPFALAAVTGAVVLLAGWRTIDRNRDWKDDHTLFTRDVLTSPNSALLNANASLYYLAAAELPQNASRRQELLMTAKAHLERAIEIHPRFASAHINLGLVHFRLDRLDEAEREWLLADTLRRNDPMVQNNLRSLGEAYFRDGLELGSNAQWRPALELFEKALRYLPSNAAVWTNIGKAHYWLKENDRAREAWQRALQLEPGRRDAVAGLAVVGDKAP
jgi:tetratricopeptide (TPR) repeat protein